MDVEKLFQGIAVIFDDEINDPTSTIYTIKKNIQSKNIPVAVYNEMPRQEIIPSLSNAAFVILDWDYTNSKLDVESSERVSIPIELKANQEQDLIQFISKLLCEIFIPVFIFTSKSVDSIKTTLRDAKLWNDDKENRIFIKQKNDINTEAQLFEEIENWIKAMPSVYVLKEWEKNISKSKDAMFIELYGYSPNWVKIIWDMLKEDSIENHREFGEFVTRNLNNRIGTYEFDENIIGAERGISPEELRRVVEGERYLFYDTQPEQAYTGDLFEDDNEYYLNIRAQCDLSRRDVDSGEYNPKLYCIKGKKLRSKDIVTDDIRMTTEETLIFDKCKSFSLDEMCEICKDNDELKKFNKNFTKYRNGIFFRKGTFLERNDKVILGCVAGKQALQFNLDISIKEFNDVKDKRIGRILPPYITRIQQKCAQNMVREGVMPVPEGLFMSF
ncbi:hypothetical protein [Mogibacterium pumilum]|uniref:Response receiver domain-containing protein n=1 Tax=Mogibacterium pumilum TaxID=86332 RepID=A0A223ARW0_9FIRM|nr:hypothetical protein [Mogibacterium pumilum]ASS37708.1 hypothetical protein AXF17_04060 [Mogibacterium pumilum]